MNRAIDGAVLRDVQRFEDVNTLYKVIGVVAGWALSLLCGGVLVATGVMG